MKWLSPDEELAAAAVARESAGHRYECPDARGASEPVRRGLDRAARQLSPPRRPSCGRSNEDFVSEKRDDEPSVRHYWRRKKLAAEIV